MILLLYLLVLVFSLAILKLEYEDKSPFLFMWCIMDLLLSMPFFFLRNSYADYVFIYVFTFVILCKGFYLLTLFLLRWSFAKRNNNYKIEFYPLGTYPTTKKMIYTFIVLIVIITLLSGLSFSGFLDSTVNTKREMGGLNLIYIMLISIVSPFLITSFLKKEKAEFYLILTVYLFILLFFRSRSILVFVLLPLAYYVFYWVKNGKLYLLILAVLTLFLAVGLKVIRYQGSLKSGLDVNLLINEIPNQIYYEIENGAGDLFVGKVFYNVVRDADSYTPWYGKNTLVNKFVSIVSPVSGEIKTVEYLLFDNYVYAASSGSLHPTGYGVAYADFSNSLGFLLFVFLAFIRMFVHSQIVQTVDARLLGICMYFCVFFARGSVYNSLVFLIATAGLWAILNFLIYKKRIF